MKTIVAFTVREQDKHNAIDTVKAQLSNPEFCDSEPNRILATAPFQYGDIITPPTQPDIDTQPTSRPEQHNQPTNTTVTQPDDVVIPSTSDTSQQLLEHL